MCSKDGRSKDGLQCTVTVPAATPVHPRVILATVHISIKPKRVIKPKPPSTSTAAGPRYRYHIGLDAQEVGPNITELTDRPDR